MAYIDIYLDEYTITEHRTINVDLDNYPDAVKEQAESDYSIDIDEILNERRIRASQVTFTFACNNLADEVKIQDIIEKYELGNLLI